MEGVNKDTAAEFDRQLALTTAITDSLTCPMDSDFVVELEKINHFMIFEVHLMR